MNSLVQELKRRKLIRVAVVYAATAFVALQAADLLASGLALPAWVFAAITAAALVGFPLALVLAWAFDIAPDGVVRTEAEVHDDERHRGPHLVVSRATLRTQPIAAAAGVLILALTCCGIPGWRTFWTRSSPSRSVSANAPGGKAGSDDEPDSPDACHGVRDSGGHSSSRRRALRQP